MIKEMKVDPIPLTNVLNSLSEIDKLCNEPELDPNFHAKIANLKRAWNVLVKTHKVTTPNKIHIILDHLGDYFESSGETFYKKSDQTIESVHQLFSKLLNKGYLCKNTLSKQFKLSLFNAVLHFNGYHQ